MLSRLEDYFLNTQLVGKLLTFQRMWMKTVDEAKSRISQFRDPIKCIN